MASVNLGLAALLVSIGAAAVLAVQLAARAIRLRRLVRQIQHNTPPQLAGLVCPSCFGAGGTACGTCPTCKGSGRNPEYKLPESVTRQMAGELPAPGGINQPVMIANPRPQPPTEEQEKNA